MTCVSPTFTLDAHAQGTDALPTFPIQRHITFRAPENVWSSVYVLGDNVFATDVFCLAVISCEVLCGGNPTRSLLVEQMWKSGPPNNLVASLATAPDQGRATLEHQLHRMVAACSEAFEDLKAPLKMALAPQPADRPRAEQVHRALLAGLGEDL